MKYIVLSSLAIFIWGSAFSQDADNFLKELSLVGQNKLHCDNSYIENKSDYLEITSLATIDCNKLNLDISWSFINSINSVLLDVAKINKFITKGKASKNCETYNYIEGNISVGTSLESGRYKLDTKYLHVGDRSYIKNTTQWKNVKRLGYEVSYLQNGENFSGIIFQLSNEWFLFDLQDTLASQKIISKTQIEKIEFNIKRTEATAYLKKAFENDLTLFFKDTSLYIFEIPRLILLTKHGDPAPYITDSLELFTYQVTNDSTWFVSQFSLDTTRRANNQPTTASKSPICLGKIKFQDLYAATNGFDLSQLKGEQLYNFGWDAMEYRATMDPEKYRPLLEQMFTTSGDLSSRFKNPKLASKLTYRDFQPIYEMINYSEWHAHNSNAKYNKYRAAEKFVVSMSEPEYGHFSSHSITIGEDEFNFSFRVSSSNPADSNYFSFEGETYDKRLDNFIPFKTKVTSSYLVDGDYNTYTVSGEEAMNKLMGLLMYQTMRQVIKQN
jgi:hypothetical protein